MSFCPLLGCDCLQEKCQFWTEYIDRFEEKFVGCLVVDYLQRSVK